MTSKRAEFEGAEGNSLIADRYGRDGSPVLLLHGGGQTRHSWDAAAERIAALGHVVYSMDLRGHGESSWVPSRNYALDDFGADLVAVSGQIAVLHRAKPVVVGASLGGMAGMLAEGKLHPGSMAALVLVDITPRMDLGGVEKILGFMGDKVEQGFASVDEAADAIAKYLPNRARPKDQSGLSKNLRLHEDGRYRWHWDPAFLRHRGYHDADHRAEGMQGMLVAASNLSVPVLLVRGRNSELVSMDHVSEFMDLVPHAKFTDIRDAGHMIAGDRNDVFAQAVEEFLTDLRGDALID